MNVMCTTLGIPDDVAGATFMAAGASSPELFTALISQFITESDVGLGAVVGSEVFNMLIICAASAIYAEGGRVQLEWKTLSRELVFYALSCGLLLYVAMAISCRKSLEADHYCNESDGKTHIDIVWWESLVLFLMYIVYALVCSYYNSHIIPWLCPMGGQNKDAYSSLKGELGGALLDSDYIAMDDTAAVNAKAGGGQEESATESGPGAGESPGPEPAPIGSAPAHQQPQQRSRARAPSLPSSNSKSASYLPPGSGRPVSSWMRSCRPLSPPRLALQPIWATPASVSTTAIRSSMYVVLM